MQSVRLDVQDPNLAPERRMHHREDVSAERFQFDRHLPASPSQHESTNPLEQYYVKLPGRKYNLGLF